MHSVVWRTTNASYQLRGLWLGFGEQLSRRMHLKWAKTCVKTSKGFMLFQKLLSLTRSEKLSLSISLHCAPKREKRWRRARPATQFTKWQMPLDSLITRPHLYRSLCFLVSGVSIQWTPLTAASGEFVGGTACSNPSRYPHERCSTTSARTLQRTPSLPQPHAHP